MKYCGILKRRKEKQRKKRSEWNTVELEVFGQNNFVRM